MRRKPSLTAVMDGLQVDLSINSHKFLINSHKFFQWRRWGPGLAGAAGWEEEEEEQWPIVTDMRMQT